MKFFLFFLSLFFVSFAEDASLAKKENIEALKKIEEHLIANSSSSAAAPQNEPSTTLPQEEETPSSLNSTVSYEKAFIKMLIILFVILVFVFTLFWLFRKFAGAKMQQFNHVKTIKILEKRAISPKSMLYLVEIGGQKILLAESQYEIRNVSDLKWLENTKQGL